METNHWNILRGDLVQVIQGPQAGQQGKVLKVIRPKNRVIVDGVNMVSAPFSSASKSFSPHHRVVVSENAPFEGLSHWHGGQEGDSAMHNPLLERHACGSLHRVSYSSFAFCAALTLCWPQTTHEGFSQVSCRWDQGSRVEKVWSDYPEARPAGGP